MKNTVVISIVVLAIIGGLVYMSMNKAPAEKMEATATAESIEVDAMSEIREIVVVGSAFKFEPSAITVKKGEKVKIVFKNAGGMHDFRVDELGVKTEILKDGGEETVEFTADQAGTYEYYCSVGEHRAMGMVGTLTVEE